MKDDSFPISIRRQCISTDVLDYSRKQRRDIGSYITIIKKKKKKNHVLSFTRHCALDTSMRGIIKKIMCVYSSHSVV